MKRAPAAGEGLFEGAISIDEDGACIGVDVHRVAEVWQHQLVHLGYRIACSPTGKVSIHLALATHFKSLITLRS